MLLQMSKTRWGNLLIPKTVEKNIILALKSKTIDFLPKYCMFHSNYVLTNPTISQALW